MKSTLDPVLDIHEVMDGMVKIKSLKKGFLTNFYPDLDQVSLWIQEKKLWKREFLNTVFYLKSNDSFNYLYFLSSGYECLSADLDSFLAHEHKVLVAEIVTQKENDDVLTLFKTKLFYTYAILVRLSMKTPDLASTDFPEQVRIAKSFDLRYVEDKLNSAFDRYSERLPHQKELEHFIQNGCVLLYEDDGGIRGFILYEVDGVTQHLRYWFVDPDFRNKKVGSSLFNAYLVCGNTSKRQILWCRTDNDNAMKRYEHYGYKREKMYDHIIRWKS